MLHATEFHSLHATVYSFNSRTHWYNTQTKIRHTSKDIDSDMQNVKVVTKLLYTHHWQFENYWKNSECFADFRIATLLRTASFLWVKTQATVELPRDWSRSIAATSHRVYIQVIGWTCYTSPSCKFSDSAIISLCGLSPEYQLTCLLYTSDAADE